MFLRPVYTRARLLMKGADDADDDDDDGDGDDYDDDDDDADDADDDVYGYDADYCLC